MRSTKELLILIREYIIEKKPDFYGLCYVITKLYENNIITLAELDNIRDFIHSNRPKRGKYYIKGRSKTLFFWPSGDFEIRLKWIERQIQKN